MSIAGIQGQLLEVTVVGCHKLKDTEWISRQDPYVVLEYASTKFRTRTCTDGGKNPIFQEKFVFNLIEGLREINVVVWNSNTLTFDDYIGSGKIQLNDVLSRGYDDRAWPLQTKTGRHAGEVKLIMHFAKTNKPYASSAPSAPPYAASPQPQAYMYSAPSAPPSVSHINTTSAYPPPPTVYPSPPTAYSYGPHPPAAYPSMSPYPYPPNPSAYPPYPYPPPLDHSTYPPAAYPPPPSAYPPQPYPPPHQAPSYPHSGNYPGMYPPPPY